MNFIAKRENAPTVNGFFAGCIFILILNSLGFHAGGQIITNFAGCDTACYGYAGDGGPATASLLNYPSYDRADRFGNLYIVDLGNSVIRKVNTEGIISTIAGNGNFGHWGDGGPATDAAIEPNSIAIDAAGNLYIADWNLYVSDSIYTDSTASWTVSPAWIRKVDTSGNITTIAGSGAWLPYSGEGGQATAATLQSAFDVATDNGGNIYIVDFYASAVYKVDPAGIITTIAGINDSFGYSGDGNAATTAVFQGPVSVLPDNNGSLYIADALNSNVRKINDSGIISTFAGSGYFFGDGNPATVATLNTPLELAMDPAGNIFIADDGDNVARVVTTDGIIHTFAGNVFTGNSGDGGPAKYANFINVNGIAADLNGNVYIVDQSNNRVRMVTPVPSGVAKPPEPAAAMQVWPDPNEGKFTVKIADAVSEPVQITITNIVGQVQRQMKTYTNTAIDIWLDALPGIYFVVASIPGATSGILTKKIVVE